MIKPQFLLLLLTTAFKWRTIKISWYGAAAGTTSGKSNSTANKGNRVFLSKQDSLKGALHFGVGGLYIRQDPAF